MNVVVDRSFRSNFAFDVLAELPQPMREPHVHYPGATPVGGRDGVLVRLQPTGSPAWIGTFGFGDFGPSGVYGMPGPGQLCVVARGSGYTVASTNASEWRSIRMWQIESVFPVPARGLLVFANCLHLIAHNADGECWRTTRLALDGLRVTEVTADHIRGEYTVHYENRVEAFSVDLRTGESTGGYDPSDNC